MRQEPASGVTDETREKMRAAAKARMSDPAIRDKISAALKGKPKAPFSAERRINMSVAAIESPRHYIPGGWNKGQSISEDQKAKLRAASIGKPWSPARRAASQKRKDV